GPARSSTARVAATSAAKVVSGSCTTCTVYPSRSRMSATGFQPEPSANAPWTRTTFFTAADPTEVSAMPARASTSDEVFIFSLMDVSEGHHETTQAPALR